jgi:hypothetical protein
MIFKNRRIIISYKLWKFGSILEMCLLTETYSFWLIKKVNQINWYSDIIKTLIDYKLVGVRKISTNNSQPIGRTFDFLILNSKLL